MTSLVALVRELRANRENEHNRTYWQILRRVHNDDLQEATAAAKLDGILEATEREPEIVERDLARIAAFLEADERVMNLEQEVLVTAERVSSQAYSPDSDGFSVQSTNLRDAQTARSRALEALVDAFDETAGDRRAAAHGDETARSPRRSAAVDLANDVSSKRRARAHLRGRISGLQEELRERSGALKRVDQVARRHGWDDEQRQRARQTAEQIVERLRTELASAKSELDGVEKALPELESSFAEMQAELGGD